LFNEVHDFLIDVHHLYFKEWEYKEHNLKYGTRLEKVEHYIFLILCEKIKVDAR